MIVTAWYNKVKWHHCSAFREIPHAVLELRIGLSSPTESQLSEAGDWITSGRLHLLHGAARPVLLVPATSSLKRPSPGAFYQRACHYLQVDLVIEPNVWPWFNYRKDTLPPTSEHSSDLKHICSQCLGRAHRCVLFNHSPIGHPPDTIMWHTGYRLSFDEPPPCAHLTRLSSTHCSSPTESYPLDTHTLTFIHIYIHIYMNVIFKKGYLNAKANLIYLCAMQLLRYQSL